MAEELEISGLDLALPELLRNDSHETVYALRDAIDLVSEKGMTWLTRDGERIAAIVPVADIAVCLRHLEPLQTVSVRWHKDGSECK